MHPTRLQFFIQFLMDFIHIRPFSPEFFANLHLDIFFKDLFCTLPILCNISSLILSVSFLFKRSSAPKRYVNMARLILVSLANDGVNSVT